MKYKRRITFFKNKSGNLCYKITIPVKIIKTVKKMFGYTIKDPTHIIIYDNKKDKNKYIIEFTYDD
jgi:hypothetical protein